MYNFITIREEVDNLLKNIVYLRKKNNLSKKTMSEKIGISVYSLNIIEKGELPKGATVQILFNIEKGFGISPSQQFIKLEK